MTQQQRDYTLAKARFASVKEAKAQAERDYIAANSITNPDGDIPEALWMIDDDAMFEQALNAIGETHGQDVIAAESLLTEAEDALIRFGLGIMPPLLAKERTTLENACFGLNGSIRNYTTRQNLVETTMLLDARTIPAGYRPC